MTRARILLVEDDGVTAMKIEESLAALGHDLVGEATSGEEAVRLARDLRPDLILMDIVLSGTMDGIQAAGEIRTFSPVRILFLSGHSEQALIERAKEVESREYLLKPVSRDQLRVSIELALAGNERENVRPVFEDPVAPLLARLPQLRCLSYRELEVGHLVMEGERTKEIARRLEVSPETVSAYRKSIREKLGLKNEKTGLRSYFLSLV